MGSRSIAEILAGIRNVSRLGLSNAPKGFFRRLGAKINFLLIFHDKSRSFIGEYYGRNPRQSILLQRLQKGFGLNSRDLLLLIVGRIRKLGFFCSFIYLL